MNDRPALLVSTHAGEDWTSTVLVSGSDVIRSAQVGYPESISALVSESASSCWLREKVMLTTTET